MKKKKEILHLLEEVQEIAQTLCSENADLGDQVKKTEAEMSTLRAAKTQLAQALQAKTELTQKVETLQASNAQLTQELQATKTQLAQARQAPPPEAEPTKIQGELSKLRAEKTQEIWNLQDINTHLTQELQTTKTQLAQARQAPPPKAEPTQEVQTLQASNAQLTKELQDALAQLGLGIPSSQENIESLPPEFQHVKEKLKNVELHNQLFYGRTHARGADVTGQ